ncbi:MAG: AmmeMemoRadiSam system protein B [Ignavibacteria bacterium]|nr:AmmeMemoRadiSam system protein B [Ignavibacteria bacterium]
MKEKIRKAVFSGGWYNGNPKELTAEIKEYLDQAKHINKNVRAVIVPHAGYMFSGQVAAHSYKQISPDTKKVFVLGTSHRYYLQGVCVGDYDYLETPLGRIKVSKDVKIILKEKHFSFIPEADKNEHSIEIELPFLKHILVDFEIIPLLVGSINYKELAGVIGNYIDDKTVIVVSVDLSHFHSYHEAKRLDEFTINAITSLNTDKIPDAEIDSPYAVLGVMELAKLNNWNVKLLEYKNSGDITGDLSRVVGYASIAFFN